MGIGSKIKQMDSVKLFELIIGTTVIALGLIFMLAASLLASTGNEETKDDAATDFQDEVIQKDLELNFEDTDGDGLPNIQENYMYGTNISNPDTDGDGMDDKWEVDYGYGLSYEKTGELLIDPNDPTDAYEDPDKDGYDFNGDGIPTDEFPMGEPLQARDSIYFSDLNVPPDSDYTLVDINTLRTNPTEWNGKMIRLETAKVVDNGTYRQGMGSVIDFKKDVKPSAEFTCTVKFWANDKDERVDRVEVCVDISGNRPINIEMNTTRMFVDIQGLFYMNPNTLEVQIQIRGGEEFTNIMEYQSTRDYDNNPETINETNPLRRDTDGDGIFDGWEVAFGEGYYNLSNQGRWEWLYHIDPTWDGDKMMDIDGDIIQYNGEWRGGNFDEFNFGTNPNHPDTDRDSYDNKGDGWTYDDNNAWDFSEVFVYNTTPTDGDSDDDGMTDGWEIKYGLDPHDPSDKYLDPDKDELLNYEEFKYRTDPRDGDSDNDLMPDGWEVKYNLNPNNRLDAMEDQDYDRAGNPRPDGLINLYEYYNNTDPTYIDTDDDQLSDFEEILQGFEVTVNGKLEVYFTCATEVDTDFDDNWDDEDGDNYYNPNEEYMDERDNDGDKQIDEEMDMNDYNEAVYGIQVPKGGRYITNASNPDSDGDGLSDYVELFTDREPDIPGIQNTDPTEKDTDGDGLTDYQEVLGIEIWLPGRAVRVKIKTSPLRVDSDNDGLSDGLEIMTDFDPKPNEKKTVILKDVRSQDTNETLYFQTKYSDSGIVNSTDPRDDDTDDDGMNDGFEYDNSDLDRDGMPTWWEDTYGLNLLRPTLIDTNFDGILDSEEDFDLDGLENLDEYRRRLDPHNDDSDDDGTLDSDEAIFVELPVDQNNDGYVEREEYFITDVPLLQRQPIYGDGDGDLMPDWWEIKNGLNPSFNDSGGDIDRDGFCNIDEYIYNTDTGPGGSSETDFKDHALTFSPYACDKDQDGIGDWWEKFYWGSIDACDPSANDDGPTPTFLNGDNWTNIMEWRHVSVHDENLFRTIPVPEWTDAFGQPVFGNDTDGDGTNDDVDANPIRFMLGPHPHPMNPIAGAAAMNPLYAGDLYGDTDSDNMPNLEEFRRPLGRTDPTDPDSDQDGMPDGWEWGYGLYDNETEDVNIDPLDPDDWWEDFDEDGVNYSRKFTDDNENKRKDENETWTLMFIDFDGDGLKNPLWENETFSTFEEYLTGIDIDADGMLENSTNPNKWDTDEDLIPDGYEVMFSDVDGDGLSNWYEILYHLNPNDASFENGSAGDPDFDGFNNTEEYRGKPYPTNPLNDADHPLEHKAGGRSVDIVVEQMDALVPDRVTATSNPVNLWPNKK